jgi:quinol monooxygenase YgiN
MANLTIVAVLKVDPTKLDDLRPLFAALIEETRKEDGCLLYDLHHDNVDPSRFVFYETWTTRDLWQDHMNSAHIRTFQQASKDAVISADVFEMSKV